MRTPLKTVFLFSLAIILSGCVAFSEAEMRALKDAGIAAAKSAPKEMHLAYLQCYSLPRSKKPSCRRSIKDRPIERQQANSWEFIRPYDYEAERQGFIHFLRDHGKTCAGIDEGAGILNMVVILCPQSQSGLLIDIELRA